MQITRFAIVGVLVALVYVGSYLALIFHLMDRNHRLPAGPLQRICL